MVKRAKRAERMGRAGRTERAEQAKRTERAKRTDQAERSANLLGEKSIAGIKRVWRAASYARLSVEDDEMGASSSIVSQQRIIEAYVAERDDIELVARFVDDGWTGSNFERPGFQEMMEAVESGAIDCIVVKDLSRFGRNYLDAGRYLERVFPEKGIRFIAVSDNYDGLRGGANVCGLEGDDALLVPFKNLMNDWYCANASEKSRRALAVRREKGLFVGSFAPYGYLKDPANKNVLLPDPATAPVVGKIYEMRAHGHSLAAIASALNAEGVPSPAAYRKMTGCRKVAGVAAPGPDGPRWHASQIGKMLQNELYAGVLEQGKTFSPSFRTKMRIAIPRERWARVEGACPALVSRELFETVQAIGESCRIDVGRKGTGDDGQVGDGRERRGERGRLDADRREDEGSRRLGGGQKAVADRMRPSVCLEKLVETGRFGSDREKAGGSVRPDADREELRGTGRLGAGQEAAAHRTRSSVEQEDLRGTGRLGAGQEEVAS